jgi:5-methylcytosine-specific restriction enzyme B
LARKAKLDNPEEYPISNYRDPEKARALSSNEIGLNYDKSTEALNCDINKSDPIYLKCQQLLDDGHSGIIFSGPPGTSKTWYAQNIASLLGERDQTRVRFVQFHPSYQYEDFVEGYIPSEDGSFKLQPKHLLQMGNYALENPSKLYILVIDELSRCDPARVFGEALTYIESSKRGQTFSLPSGTIASIPKNLVFLATMNEFDKGVEEVDAALQRRFARIALDPDATILRRILESNRLEQPLTDKILGFFTRLMANENPYARIGHAYFRTVTDENTLKRLWDHQLRFHFERAFRLDDEGFRAIKNNWDQMLKNEPEQTVEVQTAP